jgi:hypothetical protein
MRALIKQVLAVWREAERVVGQTALGTRKHKAAVAAVERPRPLHGTRGSGRTGAAFPADCAA